MSQKIHEFDEQIKESKNNSISENIQEKAPEIINEINNFKTTEINQNPPLLKENDGNNLKNLNNDIQAISKKKIYNTFSDEFKKKVLEDVN